MLSIDIADDFQHLGAEILASNFAAITKSPFSQEMASEDCLFPGSCVRCSLLVADGSLFTKKLLLSHFDVCKDIL
jgi:hypothetical protein